MKNLIFLSLIATVSADFATTAQKLSAWSPIFKLVNQDKDHPYFYLQNDTPTLVKPSTDCLAFCSKQLFNFLADDVSLEEGNFLAMQTCVNNCECLRAPGFGTRNCVKKTCSDVCQIAPFSSVFQSLSLKQDGLDETFLPFCEDACQCIVQSWFHHGEELSAIANTFCVSTVEGCGLISEELDERCVISAIAACQVSGFYGNVDLSKCVINNLFAAFPALFGVLGGDDQDGGDDKHGLLHPGDFEYELATCSLACRPDDEENDGEEGSLKQILSDNVDNRCLVECACESLKSETFTFYQPVVNRRSAQCASLFCTINFDEEEKMTKEMVAALPPVSSSDSAVLKMLTTAPSATVVGDKESIKAELDAFKKSVVGKSSSSFVAKKHSSCQDEQCLHRCSMVFGFENDDFGRDLCHAMCTCQSTGVPTRVCATSTCHDICSSFIGEEYPFLTGVCHDFCFCNLYESQSGRGLEHTCGVQTCKKTRYMDELDKCTVGVCMLRCLPPPNDESTKKEDGSEEGDEGSEDEVDFDECLEECFAEERTSLARVRPNYAKAPRYHGRRRI